MRLLKIPVVLAAAVLLGTVATLGAFVLGRGTEAGAIIALVCVFSGLYVQSLRSRGRVARSEEQYRLLFDSNPNSMWVFDVATLRFLAANAAAVKTYGYSAEQFLSMTIADIRPREEVPRLLAAIHTPEAAKAHRERWHHRRSDGSLINVEVTSQPIVFRGRAARVVLAVDINARTAVEDALHESEQRYRELIENASDLIATIDLEERFTTVNKAFADALGYTTDELLGRALNDFVPTGSEPVLQQALRTKLSGASDATTYEHELLAKDGRRVVVETASRLITRDDIPVGVQAICRDITERRELEQRLHQSEKLEAIGRLAGGIAHDFNNLLTAINGYSDVALSELTRPGDESVRDVVTEIRSAGDRAAELTRQLLAFSRRQLLQPAVLDINESVREFEPMLSRLLGDDVLLELALEPDLGSVKADAGQIGQVVLNLAVNARDAMPNGGLLTITTHNVVLDEANAPDLRPGPYVVLAVTDSGTGIDPETLERIFEPFFTTKAHGEGTGLGLATVHGIAQQSGGRVTVYSELGHGATFKVYLPQTLDSADPESASEPNAMPGGEEMVLLVEDDDAVRKLAHRMLESLGYAVQTAASPKEALRISARFGGHIDVLLTDIVMPELNGAELAELLLAQRPGLRVLYMSGFTGDAMIRRGALDRDAAFLPKPFSPADLAQALRRVLEAAPVSYSTK